MRDDEPREAACIVKFADALQRAGISKLVLHAWERRYDVQLSERTATGRRFMTETQVERLRLLKLCTDAGYRIANIISLPDLELLRIAEQHALRLDLCSTLDAAQRLDSAALSADLERRVSELGPLDFVRRVVSPLMDEIGKRWQDGTMSIAAEHLVSAEVRRILSDCLHRFPVAPDATRAVATTPEGELHELGALVITLLSRSHGIDTLYLGPNLPNDQIVNAALRSGARVVFLSCLVSSRRNASGPIVALRGALPPHIALFVGGPGASDMAPLDGVSIFPNIESINAALRDIGTAALPARGLSNETR
ncbi:MerR family transcriptional regulator [Affinirhizobium pseudoryzae]|jgi:DNA-binding transcriptional MerR regulator/methylmalonyl-CoA mutase cobalamin-binding subunit|uniref:MerR family transcriptional regulator n=1 Tax=Allorhizobium pseudoryzae TaxID=379684 RepID=UPI0013EB5EAA|nr:cobalamin B12-binding domain-containing protein [Allorhizobium pseudoryzae]